MKGKLFTLLFLGVLVALPNLASADCADIGGFNSFSVSGSTVTLYSRNRPYVKFDVQCSVEPKSKIQLIKSYVCDGDEILVDGSNCTIMSITSSGF